MLRSQDIFVTLSLLDEPRSDWTFDSLAERIGMSKSQIFRSLKRADISHLYDAASRRVRTAELLEFLAHGIRYAFAVEPGKSTRGMPTAWDAPGLEDVIVSNVEEHYVWPHPRGTHRGQSIAPLHDGVITAASESPHLYRRLALCDVIRLGSARERSVAADRLAEALK